MCLILIKRYLRKIILVFPHFNFIQFAVINRLGILIFQISHYVFLKSALLCRQTFKNHRKSENYKFYSNRQKKKLVNKV